MTEVVSKPQASFNMMKAAVYTRYGPPEVVEIKEVPKPAPKENEVLIKVRATTVTTGDWRLRSLTMPYGFGLISRFVFGLWGPRQTILGTEIAGEVEAVGKAVKKFKVGDHVIAFTGAKMGCHVEYKCIPESGLLVLKPSNISFEEAAALCFGGITAVDFLRKAKLQSGERILVNGASGGVGSAIVQIAKHMGAEVTAVCSGGNLELVKSIGASHCIDYKQHDFTQNGEAYDLIVDVAGTSPFSRCKGSLKERGRLLLVLAGLPDILSALWISLTSRKKVVAGPSDERLDDMQALVKLAESGAYKPVIGRRYPLNMIVEAHRLVDSGHKRGSVVVTM